MLGIRRRKKKKGDESAAASPQLPEKEPKYTKESMTSLIEKRNAKFHAAVSELLVACAAHQPPEDPVELLLAATEENLPVKPDDDEAKGLREKKDDLEFYQRNPDMRPSIEALIEEIREQESYREQIVEGGHRIFDARDGAYGEPTFLCRPSCAEAGAPS